MACVVSFLFLAKELSILSRRGEAGRDIESSVPLSRADRNLPWDESVCARTYTYVHVARNREVGISVTTRWDNGTGDKLTNELKASGWKLNNCGFDPIRWSRTLQRALANGFRCFFYQLSWSSERAEGRKYGRKRLDSFLDKLSIRVINDLSDFSISFRKFLLFPSPSIRFDRVSRSNGAQHGL